MGFVRFFTVLFAVLIVYDERNGLDWWFKVWEANRPMGWSRRKPCDDDGHDEHAPHLGRCLVSLHLQCQGVSFADLLFRDLRRRRRVILLFVYPRWFVQVVGPQLVVPTWFSWVPRMRPMMMAAMNNPMMVRFLMANTESSSHHVGTCDEHCCRINDHHSVQI